MKTQRKDQIRSVKADPRTKGFGEDEENNSREADIDDDDLTPGQDQDYNQRHRSNP